MKEYTRDQGAAELAADLAYVRLKSGERPFKPYGETLALPGVNTKPVASRKIPANEGTTAAHAAQAERGLRTGFAAPAVDARNIVSLADARSQRKAPRA